MCIFIYFLLFCVVISIVFSLLLCSSLYFFSVVFCIFFFHSFFLRTEPIGGYEWCSRESLEVFLYRRTADLPRRIVLAGDSCPWRPDARDPSAMCLFVCCFVCLGDLGWGWGSKWIWWNCVIFREWSRFWANWDVTWYRLYIFSCEKGADIFSLLLFDLSFDTHFEM